MKLVTGSLSILMVLYSSADGQRSRPDGREVGAARPT
jgi:hypothetical protein